MPDLIAAIDQGTTSSRCILFDLEGRIAGQAQAEHRQIYPRPGWVEHDAREVWDRVQECMRGAAENAGARPGEILAVGITNQRETVVVWDRLTGTPVCNAIVWQDMRTEGHCRRLADQGGIGRFRELTGLPVATYFTGPKLAWILENVEGVRERAARGDLLAGTIDAWLVWNLTGGPDGGVHATDVTNASRTLCMDLRAGAWSDAQLDLFGIPKAMLPTIAPSGHPHAYGTVRMPGPFGGVPVMGVLGDQQAALVGQACFEKGEAKTTYGTGCFVLMNTGTEPVISKHGLITTAAYRFGGEPTRYALEGSVAIAGALVQWLRDNLEIIARAPEIEALAASVPDNGGVYFVPAFSGLFAPYWRSDARGVIAGLTRFATRAHLARAALEATAYQTREVLHAMEQDSGAALDSVKVDGGMVRNELLMQFQADQLGVPVIRPTVTETTSLGAAYAAGLALGAWSGTAALRAHWREDRRWTPRMGAAERERLYAGWRKAVERSLGWVES
jgi:glycerol kinase